VKGINPILGSVFLVAVGVAVAGLYSTFAGDFAQGTGGDVVEGTRSDIKCRGASLDIRNISYTSTSVRLDLVNTGTVRLQGVSTFAISSSSTVINETEVGRIAVSESRTVALRSQNQPSYVTVAVEECPGIQPREEF
jgi:hypothetical protein